MDTLPEPILELALSCLPDMRSLLSASSTCKSFHSLISSPEFLRLLHSRRSPVATRRSPWLFVFGINRFLPSQKNQSFAFDPVSLSWFRLPPIDLDPPLPHRLNCSSLLASSTNASLFALSGPNQDRLCVAASPLKQVWREIEAPMEVSRRMVASLVAVAGPKIVVAGGGEEAGEEMEVEVYEEEEEEEEEEEGKENRWRRCGPMPAVMRGSAGSLSVAVVSDPERRRRRRRSRMYVADCHSGNVCWMDVDEGSSWECVEMERPAGTRWWCLVALGGDTTTVSGPGPGSNGMTRLVAVVLLAGEVMKVLSIDMGTMRVDAELGTMPHELFHVLAGRNPNSNPSSEHASRILDGNVHPNDDDDADADTDYDDEEMAKLVSIRCTGSADLIYVFSTSKLLVDDHGPAVVMCKVSPSGDCSWLRPPPLPGRVNRFDQIICTSSHVSLSSCLTMP